jgi:hypothetical protein
MKSSTGLSVELPEIAGGPRCFGFLNFREQCLDFYIRFKDSRSLRCAVQ